MVTVLNKLSSMILSIIIWPLIVGIIVVSGIAWSANNWDFTINNQPNINAVIFILGIIVLIAYSISQIFKIFKKIFKTIFSIILLAMLCFLTYSFGWHFQNFHWTFDYSGVNQKATFFWGFGFISLISLIWIYFVTCVIWFTSLAYKRK